MTECSNSSDWEARYLSRDMPWEKGAPSPGLVDFLAGNPGLAHGSVCVPGCGTGHDVRTWARAGFGAFGYDIAPSAVGLAAEATRAANLAAEFQVTDFLQAEPPFLFDWVFEHTLFCAIQPNERDAYVRAVLRWLKPRGQYLAVNYLIPNLVLALEFYEGKPIGAVLPDTVDLLVVDTEPTVQKATASAVMKPAKLETGLMINVPPFINNGDKVKVDTTEARYIQRAQ